MFKSYVMAAVGVCALGLVALPQLAAAQQGDARDPYHRLHPEGPSLNPRMGEGSGYHHAGPTGFGPVMSFRRHVQSRMMQQRAGLHPIVPLHRISHRPEPRRFGYRGAPRHVVDREGPPRMAFGHGTGRRFDGPYGRPHPVHDAGPGGFGGPRPYPPFGYRGAPRHVVDREGPPRMAFGPGIGRRFDGPYGRPHPVHDAGPGGFGGPRPYPPFGYRGFPGPGCSVQRHISWTPFGLRRIVTVRSCLVP